MVDKLIDEREVISYVYEPTDKIDFCGYTIPVKQSFKYVTINRYGLIEGHLFEPEYDQVTGDWVSNERKYDLGVIKSKSGDSLYPLKTDHAIKHIDQHEVNFKED